MAHTLDALLREPFLLPHNRRADWENFSRLADDRTRIVSSSQMSEVDKELFDDGHTSETACYLINIDRLPPPANGKMGRGIFKLGIWVNGQMFDRVDTTHLLPFVVAHERYETWALTDPQQPDIAEAHRMARYYQYHLAMKAGVLPDLLRLHKQINDDCEDDRIAEDVVSGRYRNPI